MTQDEKKRLEKKLQSDGYKQSTQDPDKWIGKTDSYKFDSSNGFNNDGNKLRGYGTCRDRLNK